MTRRSSKQSHKLGYFLFCAIAIVILVYLLVPILGFTYFFAQYTSSEPQTETVEITLVAGGEIEMVLVGGYYFGFYYGGRTLSVGGTTVYEVPSQGITSTTVYRTSPYPNEPTLKIDIVEGTWEWISLKVTPV